MVWYMTWYDICYDMIWYDMIYDIYGVWYGMVWYIWNDMIYDMIWYGMMWYIYDMIYDMVYDMIYDMIYLLTASGLTPGDSCTIHIYTQTVHRTMQNLRTMKMQKRNRHVTSCTVFITNKFVLIEWKRILDSY